MKKFHSSQALPSIILPTSRSLCFSTTVLWYSLHCVFPCSGSVKADLENTTWLSLVTSTPWLRQSWAVSDLSRNKSRARLSREKQQLRLLYPWLYTSSRSLRQVTRWRWSAQYCRKFNLWASRSKRTGFLSRKARLMERASLMVGPLRRRSGSSMMCWAARLEPAVMRKYEHVNCHIVNTRKHKSSCLVFMSKEIYKFINLGCTEVPELGILPDWDTIQFPLRSNPKASWDSLADVCH